MKFCPKCPGDRSVTEFAACRRSKDGRARWCRKCQSTYYKEWRRKNNDKVRAREQAWRKKNRERYLAVLAMHREDTRSERVDAETARRCGLSPAEIRTLREQHDGECDICGTDDPGNGRKKMCLDHCHTTGAFRGFLCNTCNRTIGMLKDDPARLRSAADYLERVQDASGSK